MIDLHTAIDVGTLVITGLSAYLAALRSMANRITKTEIRLSHVEGILEGAGILKK